MMNVAWPLSFLVAGAAVLVGTTGTAHALTCPAQADLNGGQLGATCPLVVFFPSADAAALATRVVATRPGGDVELAITARTDVVEARDVTQTQHDACDYSMVINQRIDTESFVRVTLTLTGMMAADFVEVKDASGVSLVPGFTVMQGAPCNTAPIEDTYCQIPDGTCSEPGDETDEGGCATGGGGASLVVGLGALLIRSRRQYRRLVRR